MTHLLWLLCLVLCALSWLVLLILRRPIPRWRGGPPGESPSVGQWGLGILGIVVGCGVGLFVGFWVYLFRPDRDVTGFILELHDMRGIGALCLGSGVGLAIAVPLTWLLVNRQTFLYFRALDAKLWRGVDTLRATPFALVLLFWFGHLYTPAWLIAGGQTLEYRTALPFGHRAHSWKELKWLRTLKEQQLMFEWWAARPGVAWRFDDGTGYQAFLSDGVSTSQLKLAVTWTTRCSGVRAEHRRRND